jgi:hypothetical protein
MSSADPRSTSIEPGGSHCDEKRVKQTRKELVQRPGGAIGLDGTASWRGASSRIRERNLNARDVR